MNNIVRVGNQLFTTAELRRRKQAKRRLSAAAPDLLAALKQCLRDPNHYKSYDMAKAAIAKAEGET